MSVSRLPALGLALVLTLVLTLVGALVAPPARAHKPSDSLLQLEAKGTRLEGRWDIALRDLDLALTLDADGNGELTWGELRARHADIERYALAHLTLQLDGRPCRITAGEQLVDRHSDGPYNVLPLAVQCPAEAAEAAASAAAPQARGLSVGYTLFARLDPTHRGLLRLGHAGPAAGAAAAVRTAVLDPAAPAQRFTLSAAGAGAGDDSRRGFAGFLREGVWHIWIGLDHVLFLFSLLLPAVLVRRASGWLPASSLRATLIDVAKVVTAFTLAHSITLTLATLQWVRLPSALVESVIAASVVLAALNNLRPLPRIERWAAAFGFGLVHGFGFASVLAPLGLPPGALVSALLAFNLGVEVGQLALVAAFLPLAYALRATPFYRRALLQGGSLAIAAIALVWFVERAFGVEWLGITAG